MKKYKTEEKFKVNVEARPDYYVATTNGGRLQLCDFSKSTVSVFWRFRPSGAGRNTSIVDEDNPDQFPLTYFLNLCRSLLFLEYGTFEMPEVELTVEAKKLLKIK